jgi:hypothetical protein
MQNCWSIERGDELLFPQHVEMNLTIDHIAANTIETERFQIRNGAKSSRKDSEKLKAL